MARMDSKHEDMKAFIQQCLKNSKWVSTTCDIWTGGHKSFLGITVHYLEANLTRQNFAIACRRLKGSHTFKTIAKALKEILYEWGIRWNTVGMVTDNATNFHKAFKVYETQMEGGALLLKAIEHPEGAEPSQSSEWDLDNVESDGRFKFLTGFEQVTKYFSFFQMRIVLLCSLRFSTTQLLTLWKSPFQCTSVALLIL